MGAKLVIEGLSMNGTDAEVDRQVKTSGKTARLASSKPAKAHKVLSSRGGGGTDRCFVQDGDLEAIHPVCGRQRLRVICGPPADPDHLIRSAGG